MFPFLCFDTEDNSPELLKAGKSGFDKQVTQIAARTASGAKFHNRGDVPAFLAWLKSRKERYIYAHNLQYDLGNLFGDELDSLDCTLVGGRIIKAVWGKKIFVDSFNIWPMSAKKLARAFGLSKLKFDVHSKAYVFQDVEIIRQAMLFAWGFVKSLKLSHLPPTLGGLCVKVWKEFGGENCHDSSELCRLALFGGRVELFKHRNDCKRVAYTDINSLYPSMMLKEFPGILEDCGNKLKKFGVAHVKIKVPKMDIPCLPWRHEDGRIFYPYGTLEGTWTIAELNAAKERGCRILKVYQCMGTNESIKPYGEFVQRLYQARIGSKSEAEKLFFKLLMNNLYGRLGTSGVIGRTVFQTEKNKYDGIPYGEKVLVKYNMPLSEETNWSHAAYVTAYGRIALLEYMEKIGASKMIYCDTDSTIFDCPSGKLPFRTGKELGRMKLIQRCSKCGGEFPHEKPCRNSKGFEFWQLCETYAPKMYRAGSQYKAKGVPKHLAQKFIERGHVEFDLPFKMREAIRFYDRNNSRKLSVWRKVEKRNKQNYDRKLLKGNRFFPRHVSNIG